MIMCQHWHVVWWSNVKDGILRVLRVPRVMLRMEQLDIVARLA